MREGYFRDKSIKLTEREWRELLKRFDYSAKRKSGYRFVIDRECSLCKKYYFCEDCPLLFRESQSRYSCGELLRDLLSDEFPEWWCMVHIRSKEIFWSEEDGDEAKKILNFLHMKKRLLKD